MIDGHIVAAKVDVTEPVKYEPTLEAMKLFNGKTLSLPAGSNRSQGTTALAIQYLTNEDVDAHYSPFYFPEAKYQYTCFFQSLAQTGTGTLPLPKTDPFTVCEY